MDTNLLDSCREARGEIGEGGAAARNAGDEDDDVDYYQKVSGEREGKGGKGSGYLRF